MMTPQTVYAGDTPLACTVAVEQTGPLQLTVRAGQWTTTGEARITTDGPDATTEIAAGRAERLPDGVRLRRWTLDRNGVPLLKSATYTLSADLTFTLTAHASLDKDYVVEFGLLAGTPDVLVRSRLLPDAYPAPPAGWQLVHWLAGPFTVPAGTTVLDGLSIPVFGVLGGFPAGTTSADWLIQRVLGEQ